MAHNIGVVNLPHPPEKWTAAFAQDVHRVIQDWMRRATSETVEEAASTAFSTVAVSTSAGPKDRMFLVDTTGGNVIITLPAPSTVLGREFVVKRSSAGANTLTVAGSAGNIDNAGTASVTAQYEVLRVKSDGSNYWKI